MLARRDVTRAALAHKFLRDADSFLNDPVGGGGGGFGGGGSGGGVAGSISSVTISAPGGSRNNGVANPLTATSYQLALNYNGTPGPIAITMKVSGAGTYTLDLSGGGYADNNTRVNWKGYTFAITTSNPAATFLAASPASPFNNTPQLSNGGKSLTFNGGTLPSTGGNASKVHPVIRVSANAPGTIIINATPQT
jgi:hypothetical protein